MLVLFAPRGKPLLRLSPLSNTAIQTLSRLSLDSRKLVLVHFLGRHSIYIYSPAASAHLVFFNNNTKGSRKRLSAYGKTTDEMPGRDRRGAQIIVAVAT